MSKLIERNLLEIPMLFVFENNITYAYHRMYTSSGLPCYAPQKKEKNEQNQLQEIIFLPITNEEFIDNNGDSFFGFRYCFSIGDPNNLSLVEDPMSGITRIQICYEIGRIRYYPEGKKTIIIDKTYDPLIPPQIIPLQYPTRENDFRVGQAMEAITEMYCSWYVDKHV